MENRKCRPTATKEMGRPHQGPTVVISNIELQELQISIIEYQISQQTPPLEPTFVILNL